VKVNSVQLKNIRSYTQEQIEFPNGTLLLSGDIGHGKSSLLMAIEFALFGLRGSQLSGGDLLREGTNRGNVKLKFTINGEQYTVKRELTRDDSSVRQENGYIKKDTKQVLSPTELKAEVFKILGYPMEMVSKRKSLIYRYTVYTPQEEMKKIIEADEETRLNTLRKITGINRYKKIRENASEVRKQLKKPLDQLKGISRDLNPKQEKLELAKKELEEHENKKQQLTEKQQKQKQELEKHKQKKKEIEEEIEKLHELDKKKTEIENDIKNNKERIQEHKQEKQKYTEKLNEIQELEKPVDTDTESIEKKLNMLEKIKEKCLKREPGIDEELDNKIEQKKSLKKEIEELKNKKHSYNAQIKTKQKNLVELQETKNKCPVCGNKLSEKHREKEIQQKQTEISQLKNKVSQIKTDVKNKKQKTNELEQEIKDKIDGIIKRANQHITQFKEDSRKLQEYKEKKRQASETQQKIEQKKQKIKQLQRETQNKKTRLKKIKEQLTQLQQTKETIKQVEQKIQETRKKHNKTQKKLTETKTNIKNREKEIKELQKEIQEKKQADQLKRKINSYRQWLENIDSLSATIERKYMTQIQLKFNEIFNTWFRMLIEDSDLNVHVDQGFAPTIERGKTETEYQRLSGGERTSVALAYRLALNRVINQLVEDIKTKNMIILDEPTDGFSTNQLDKIRDIIEELNMQQIILVSHEPKMESYVDNIIKIEKKNGASTATTI